MLAKQAVCGYQAIKWALEAFGFLILKYEFSHILETLFLSVLTLQCVLVEKWYAEQSEAGNFFGF